MTVLEFPTWERLLALMALIGVVVSFWRQLVSIVQWVKSLLIVTRAVDHSTGQLLVAFLHATMRLGPPRMPSYSSAFGFVKPMGRIFRVVYQVLYGGTEGLTFWNGLRPLWFRSVDTSTNNKGSGGGHWASRIDYLFQFSFVRGTYDWEDLLFRATVWEDSLKHGDQGKRRRFAVYTHYGSSGEYGDVTRDRHTKASSTNEPPGTGGPIEWNSPTVGHRFLRWTPDDIAGNAIVSTMDQLSLRPELVELVDVIRFWHDSQPWYLERGIPWRLGILGHGKPGTGKTSLIRAVAEQLDMPIHTFDLASMSNQDLQRSWKRMLADAPCIALLEDLDGVFEGRTNITSQPAYGSAGLTFDTLLKCIDGVERVDGMLLYVTTNRFETMDEALSGKPNVEVADPDAIPTRPGRIDRVIEFKDLDLDGRIKMAMRILEDEALAIATANLWSLDSAAQFQERCFRIALDRRFTQHTED